MSLESAPFRCRGAGGRGFTLLELLVVLAIIGVLAAITMPALKGMRKASVMDSVMRQLMDDLALARQVAISGRTTVHVVFVPPEVETMTFRNSPPLTSSERKVINRVMNAPYRGYALYAERSVGDQPGRPRDRYITPWRNLPDGVIFALREFLPGFNPALASVDRPFERKILPFPTVDIYPTITGQPVPMPHIAFDQHGRLVHDAPNPLFQNEFLELREASVLTKRDDNGNVLFYDVIETGSTNTAYNRIEVDAFTGRARVDQPRIL